MSAVGASGVISVTLPHLSHSRINRYLHCPEQYRLYYVENLRPRYPSASLIFGQAVHEALAHRFRTRGNPVAFFLEAWKGAKDMQLSYGARESWEKLNEIGQAMLDRFIREELPRISRIEASELPFELQLSTVDVPLIGTIDLIAALDGERTIIDFKTSSSAYLPHEAVLSDQLTAYLLADGDAQQAALCVLIKTKEPRIEWHIARRGAEDFMEYLGKSEYVAHEIAAGHFYKRPGMWCKWCDFLPVCARDGKEAARTLITLS
jgi:RecB family exonuclease